MSVDAERPDEIATVDADDDAARPSLKERAKAALLALRMLGFSSLTRRIVILNLAGLVALLSGILYLNQFRAGLIDARVQSLLIQGEIIAGAIASSATVDTNQLYVDPDRLLELQAGESASPNEEGLTSLEFPINPERVAPVLRRLVTPTRTRARIYDRDGALLLDSRSLYARGDILRFDLPPPQTREPTLIDQAVRTVKRWFRRSDLPIYEEIGASNGRAYPEVKRAISGTPESIVRVNDNGEIIVSVAVPIQRFRAVTGVLLLSTQGGDIDAIVQAERFAIVRVFLVAAAVMVVLSLLLASTIAGPVRKLADGAERVRNGVRRRAEIPDFTNRSDEIGHLSGALRDMTNALYARMEAIERFAADVAHELKNPLTSLRSAVETLPLARNDDSRQRLLGVIEHDVRRLDRLISDISDASRLDAELQRQDTEPVDVVKLLSTVIDMQNSVTRDDGIAVALTVADAAQGRDAYLVLGHDSRLAQVVTNLIDNARSFSPKGATVRVLCRRSKASVEIVVEDSGPGIRPDAVEKIFERFYTDRPDQGFGQNSGLGLSISRQIVEAHNGRIRAENRVRKPVNEGDEHKILGARFVVRLPAALA
ncbi:two-component system sensor histidine kinase ChvG [Methylopila capsulata]|uniref:histidine kinase n=1 Tax=Methylopila capsulata TaxID=61654 RepID=A0A9W6IWR3_9HYPH|nr:sensor histidine kinase [Methylopila capsulata]MBM7852843.1 two-component system sensor histidine kinase ChvG [Methylopila capsulata]GLK57052.1 histidine kinase [Methylopila capsulata]